MAERPSLARRVVADEDPGLLELASFEQSVRPLTSAFERGVWRAGLGCERRLDVGLPELLREAGLEL